MSSSKRWDSPLLGELVQVTNGAIGVGSKFMLLANIAVAQKIALGLPDQALLRRHEGPLERRLEVFQKRAQVLGFDIDTSSAGALMRSLNLETDKDAHVLRLLVIKAMVRAKYFCSGMLDISKYQHYALNVPMVSAQHGSRFLWYWYNVIDASSSSTPTSRRRSGVMPM
jgi:RNB domain